MTSFSEYCKTESDSPVPMTRRMSIITPSFNQGEYIEPTIRSVLNQGYPDLEYIIVDGGSTDNSVSVIRKYAPWLTYWVSEKDRGQSHAFNKGLEKATGEIIGWLNSDDVYLDRCFFQASEYFEANPAIDIVFSDYWYIDEWGKFLRRRKEIRFLSGVYLWTRNCYHANCAGFFRRRVFDTIGGLDENLQFGMDYDFYLRAAKAGLKFGHQRQNWGAYRLHGRSKSVSAHDLQKKDAILVSTRHQPLGISRFGVWWRRRLFKVFRLGWKLLLGSYFPARKSSQT